MKFLDVINGAWAIKPEKFTELTETLIPKMVAEDPGFLTREIAVPRAPVQLKAEDVRNGVAIVPIQGVTVRRLDAWGFGGTSTEDAGKLIEQAADDASIKAIVLDMDSPGGTVDGTQELSDLVRESREKKPIVALVSGMADSAGYYIASAASRILLSSEASEVGSIGVLLTHWDLSGLLSKFGVKVTHITAGKHKAIGSPFKPLDRLAEDVFQEDVNYHYKVFTQDVAKNRRVSVERVLRDMADARIFAGDQAIKAGLADGYARFDRLVRELGQSNSKQQNVLIFNGSQPTKKETEMDKVVMTSEEYNAKLSAEFERGKLAGTMIVSTTEETAIKNAMAQGREDGAKIERERIRSVEAAGSGMPGHDKLIAELKYDGVTTGSQAAEKILAAEKSAREARLAKITAEAPAPVPASPAPAAPKSAADYKPGEIALKAERHRAELATKGIKITATEAVNHVLSAEGFKPGTEPVTAEE